MRKILLLLLASTPSVFGQATVTLTVPGEASTSVIFSAEYLSGLPQWIESQSVSGVVPTTLTAASGTSDTTFSLGSMAGISPGMGILVDGEVSLVTGINPLVVTRARIGTTAAAHSNGATAAVLISGSYGQFIKNLLKQTSPSIMGVKPGPIISAQNTAIANAQAAITSTTAAAIQ